MPRPAAAAALTIRDIDVHDDAVFREFHRIYQAARAEGRPHFEPQSFEELAALARRNDPEAMELTFGVWEGEVLAGVALASGSRVDNLTHAWLFPFVDPARRRRGHGRALVEEGLRRLADQERPKVSSLVEAHGAVAVTDPQQGGLAFARALGFAVDQRDVRRVLPLPAPEARLQALEERALAALNSGAYAVDVIDGVPTAGDVAQIIALDNLLEVDAPSGSRDVEEGRSTAEASLARYRQRAGQGYRQVTVVVRDAAGAIVGHSRMVAPPDATAAIGQGPTYVRREHRGHGLGAAMKAAGIRWWMAHCPERTAIRTSNAEDNAQMVAINEVAGFEPIETVFVVIRRD